MAIWYWCWWVDLTKTATQWRIAHCLKQWGEILSIGWKLNMFDKTDKISAHVGFLICNLLFSTTILNSDMPKTNVLVIRYKENCWYVNAMCVSTRQDMQTLSVCLFVCLSVCLLVWSSATLVYMSLVHLYEKRMVLHICLPSQTMESSRSYKGIRFVCRLQIQNTDTGWTTDCLLLVCHHCHLWWQVRQIYKKMNILEVKIWRNINT